VAQVELGSKKVCWRAHTRYSVFMPTCASCGSAVPENSRFCPSCGAALASDDQATLEFVSSKPKQAAEPSTKAAVKKLSSSSRLSDEGRFLPGGLLAGRYRIIALLGRGGMGESLDRTLFWTATDLEAKLLDFQHYYNEHRTHAGRKGHPPVTGVNADRSLANLSCYRWQKHCRGLYQTPIAA
jgi:hypothetical protein